MDASLIAILVFCLAFAALLYYIIFIRREPRLSPWGESSLIALLFIITPFLVAVLWFQSQAENRLESMGFKSYPGFVSSNGIATGSGQAPIWVFSIEGDAGSVLQFYKKQENRVGWSLASESENGLIFKREGEVLSVLAGAGNVVFSIKPTE